MTCHDCERAAQRKTLGQPSATYAAHCLDCCARLVLTASPSKQQAGALLAALVRMPGSPGRARILERVSRCRAKPD
jgi:hypothetical protein